ncbi:MAG: glycosyltransferase family 39 protein [Gammaproteobacteria bacterium]
MAAESRSHATAPAASAGTSEPVRYSDLLWLALAVLIFIGTGLGTRAPWPADEPRFALIARDMVHGGDWLFPRIGGDLYPDKPPVFFWLLSVGYWLTGSLRASFLIPSFIAACTVVGLVYDLARRVTSRAAGLAAALTLACSVQFLMTMRGAQIDPTLCGLVTLSLYGLLRHLLFGPAWGWYFVGGVAAGVGVVTKGVGFLPLLVLLPYAVMRARGFNGLARPAAAGWRWWLLALGFLLGVAVWLVPMLLAVATRNDPALTAYRDEILFKQTVHRYAAAWHHVEPWYYFIVSVIPTLWLPLSLLLFWLVPRWKAAFRERDGRVWLPLAWALLALLFFSLSTGKRGVYLFPALPAAALAAAPYLPELFKRRGIQWASVVLGGVLALGALAVFGMSVAGHAKLLAQLSLLGIESLTPIAVLAFAALITWVIAAWKRPLLAWPAVLASIAVVWSYGITPRIDGERSARTFMEHVLAQVPQGTDFALMGYKEQFLLYLDRPVVNFGHARWREGEQEAYDASAWLNAKAGRVLLVPETAVKACFEHAERVQAGVSSGDQWLLVSGKAEEECAARGENGRAIRYSPPVFAGS